MPKWAQCVALCEEENSVMNLCANPASQQDDKWLQVPLPARAASQTLNILDGHNKYFISSQPYKIENQDLNICT